MLPDDPTLSRVLFRALSVSLGLSVSDAPAHLFPAYGIPPPQSSRQTNLCFFHLTPDVALPMDTEYFFALSRTDIFRYIPCTLSLVFYGPDSESWALRCRDHLYLDGFNLPLSLLRQAGMYLCPPVSPPAVSWEETGSLFRKRTDLSLSVWVRDNSDDPASREGSPSADPIESAPEVLIHNG